MFVYKSRFLTRGEVWFDETPGRAPVDWIYYRQRSAPVTNSRWKIFYTVLIDLRKAPCQLLAEMDEKTARRIAHAQEFDNLRCESCDATDDAVMGKVEEMWNRFAKVQGTAPLERQWLDRMREAGALEMVAAKDPEGNLLAYHLVLMRSKRARQLIAISPFKGPNVAWRNAVSRANCLLHWHNFLNYKDRGVEEFDFGGWYPGTTDIRLLGINRFKTSFGGRIVREYDCELTTSAKGRILLTAARLFSRLRQMRLTSHTKPRIESHATQPKEPQVSPAFR